MKNQEKEDPMQRERMIGEKLESLSVFPAAAAEALEIATSPDPDTNEFGSVIEKDVELSTEILRLANSAQFSAGQSVSSIRHAIVRLGLKRCSSLVAASATNSMMRALPLQQEWVREVLLKHSTNTAMICSFLNEELSLGFDGQEYAAGLLHDLGRWIFAFSDDEHCQSVDDYSFRENEMTIVNEQFSVGTDHCRLGTWFAQTSNLPQDLMSAIQYHHAPDIPLDCKNARLIALVATADFLCNHSQSGGAVDEFDLTASHGAEQLSKLGHPGLLENDFEVAKKALTLMAPERNTLHSSYEAALAGSERCSFKTRTRVRFCHSLLQVGYQRTILARERISFLECAFGSDRSSPLARGKESQRAFSVMVSYGRPHDDVPRTGERAVASD